VAALAAKVLGGLDKEEVAKTEFLILGEMSPSQDVKGS